MNFRQARSEYLRLRHAYRSGQIPPDEFEKQVNSMIVHNKGQVWMIGVKTGKWYRRDGKRWVEDIPEIEGEETKPSEQIGATAKNDQKVKQLFKSVYTKKPHETPQEKSFRHLTTGFSIAFIVLLVAIVLTGLMLKGVITIPSALSSTLSSETIASAQDSGIGSTDTEIQKTSLNDFLIHPTESAHTGTEKISTQGFLYSSRFLGRWRLRDKSNETLVVNKNGKSRLFSTSENYDYTITYSFVDDHTLRLISESGAIEAEIWIDSGVLTLVVDNIPLVYDRVE